MKPVIWLASYPRSGNTMTRIIFSLCFGLPTAATYREDFDGNEELQKLTGRIAPTDDGVIDFGDAPVRIIKTHGAPQNDLKAIYVIRNGIDATASFHDHGGRRIPIATLIDGRPGLWTWSEHVARWSPMTRPNTLLLRYEDLVGDVARSVDQIADFICCKPICRSIPSRDELAARDGKWVRSANAPDRTRLTAEQIEHFWRVNGPTMQQYGYAKR